MEIFTSIIKETLGPILGKVAPTIAGTLGTTVGGPIVGGIAKTATDYVVREVLGLDPETASPTEVREASAQVAANPEEYKARMVEAEAKFNSDVVQAYKEIALANSANVNETIRAELPIVKWWHWRHLFGYVPVALGVEVASLLPLVVAGKITPADMGNIMAAITSFMVIASGLLGFVASDTTRMKITAATGEAQPGILGSLAKVIKGGK